MRCAESFWWCSVVGGLPGNYLRMQENLDYQSYFTSPTVGTMHLSKSSQSVMVKGVGWHDWGENIFLALSVWILFSSVDNVGASALFTSVRVF